nr:hypothetical protein [Tanacetum cinerariifolium]
MELNSSLGKIFLGENVVEILSDKVEGSRDWNSSKFQDTTKNGQKKETKAMVFHQMDTEEVSDRFVASCFVNGLEAYDGEINLGVEENMISNEHAVKLRLEHEVERGNKEVKKELIVALRGEIYFVKFIINPEEDDVEPGENLKRTFLRMTKAITNFEAGTITIYPEFDLFLEDIEEEEKSLDDQDHLLDFNLDDIPLLGEEELPPFICKMGKSNRNKKRSMENLSLFYQDIRTSSSVGSHLTQEEAVKEALSIRISQKFALLEEKDKVKLDGKIVKEKEEAIKRIKGEALKEKDDPGAFIFPIRLEGKVNENELADTRSDINTMPYRIYETLGREEMKKVNRGITMINHTQAEFMGMLTNVLCQVGVTTIISKFLILDIPIDRDALIVVGRGFITAKSDSDDEEEYQIKRNKFGAMIYRLKPVPYLNCNDPAERPLALQEVINSFQNISVWKKEVSFLGSLRVPLKQVNWKPDYKGCYTKEEEATRQWHYGGNDDEAGSSRSKCSRLFETVEEVLLPQVRHEMEIRQEAIKRMEYRQSYHWDMYEEVFEHMAVVYSVPLQEAYNPPGYAQPQYDQYYQQYPPPPPQQHQQQDDDK